MTSANDTSVSTVPATCCPTSVCMCDQEMHRCIGHYRPTETSLRQETLTLTLDPIFHYFCLIIIILYFYLYFVYYCLYLYSLPVYILVNKAVYIFRWNWTPAVSIIISSSWAWRRLPSDPRVCNFRMRAGSGGRQVLSGSVTECEAANRLLGARTEWAYILHTCGCRRVAYSLAVIP